jgi:hypothetical protein
MRTFGLRYILEGIVSPPGSGANRREGVRTLTKATMQCQHQLLQGFAISR